MQTPAHPYLPNIRIVLVNPEYPGNVGATARAMKNTGLADLRIVGSVDINDQQARNMAIDADDILEAAPQVPSLDEALAGAQLVIGTSARGLDRHPLSPRELVKLLAAYPADWPVAIVFGTEKHGLSTRDLRRCHQLVAIPAAPAKPVLNLAQAVLIIGYELLLAQGQEFTPAGVLPAAQEGMLQQIGDYLERALWRVDFFKPYNAAQKRAVFNRILSRLLLDQEEATLLRALARTLNGYFLKYPPLPKDTTPRRRK